MGPGRRQEVMGVGRDVERSAGGGMGESTIESESCWMK